MRPFAWLALLLLCACSEKQPAQHTLTGHTMGTQFSVKLTTDNVDTAALTEALERSLAEVNDMMSTYQPDSEISRFNSSNTTEWQTVSQEFCLSVEEALALSAFTNGSFDITVGPLVNLWGFGPDGIALEPPADEDIAAMKDAVGYGNLQADCDAPAIRKAIASIALDMSAFGKGYAVDRVAEELEQSGFENYLVEIGGELRFRGKNVKGENWAIGIEVPKSDQRTPYAVIRLTDAAMATSGDYRNFFEADGTLYSHTIDTRTGRPVTHTLASVTVVDDEAARADALATALLVMGPEEGLAFATAQDVAALFLLRTPSGIDERSTPAFEQIRQQQ